MFNLLLIIHHHHPPVSPRLPPINLIFDDNYCKALFNIFIFASIFYFALNKVYFESALPIINCTQSLLHLFCSFFFFKFEPLFVISTLNCPPIHFISIHKYLHYNLFTTLSNMKRDQRLENYFLILFLVFCFLSG